MIISKCNNTKPFSDILHIFFILILKIQCGLHLWYILILTKHILGAWQPHMATFLHHTDLLEWAKDF